MLYTEGDDDKKDDLDEIKLMPDLIEGNNLKCLALNSEQHFTQPPPRYTEASLVRALETNGIGRPSTYATIMTTIMDRDYVRKENGRFVTTKLGTVVTDLLLTHFPDIMDIGFTAGGEGELDGIANGDLEWTPVLKEFYRPFDKAVESAIVKAERVPRSQIDEETDEVCEKCERPMVIKSGRFGRFIACSGFPECRNSRPLLNKIGVVCRECGGDIVMRRSKGKKSQPFYGCSNYPRCEFFANQKPLSDPCPECSGLLLKSSRSGAKCNSCTYEGTFADKEAIGIVP